MGIPDWEQHEYLHVIGVGGPEDWETDRGSVYCMEDGDGERVLPVFTTAEAAVRYIKANFDTPQAHMDMLESTPASHVGPLTGGRFAAMPFAPADIADVVARLSVDYLVKDPQPGDEQQVIRPPE